MAAKDTLRYGMLVVMLLGGSPAWSADSAETNLESLQKDSRGEETSVDCFYEWNQSHSSCKEQERRADDGSSDRALRAMESEESGATARSLR